MIELTTPLALKLMSSTLQWFSFAVIKANPNHHDGLGNDGRHFHKRAMLTVEPAGVGETAWSENKTYLKGKSEWLHKSS